jgi:hypothetical protein
MISATCDPRSWWFGGAGPTRTAGFVGEGRCRDRTAPTGCDGSTCAGAPDCCKTGRPAPRHDDGPMRRRTSAITSSVARSNDVPGAAEGPGRRSEVVECRQMYHTVLSSVRRGAARAPFPQVGQRRSLVPVMPGGVLTRQFLRTVKGGAQNDGERPPPSGATSCLPPPALAPLFPLRQPCAAPLSNLRRPANC